MSNPATASALQVTRWWWVRHAPVREDGGNIYGQSDIGCDCGDTFVFEALAKTLPRDAIWYASNLKRTHQTAEAIFQAGLTRAHCVHHEPALAEQHLGDWQGLNRVEFLASRRVGIGNYWFAPADERAPGGESFMDLLARVRGAVARINVAHPGQDIVAVAHGGTIKAAIALALEIPPDKGFAFTIDNCSVTRLDHLRDGSREGWRVVAVNQQPWLGSMAPTGHDAMHQPAGPEVASGGKLA